MRAAILSSLLLFILGQGEILLHSPPKERTPSEAGSLDGFPRESLHQEIVCNILKTYLSEKTGANPELSRKIVRVASREAGLRNVPLSRILSLIIVESWANPQARSHAGAVGLMQVLPPTARFISRKTDYEWKGSHILEDVETNIAFGTWYYAYLLRLFPKDEHAALAAYNWGPNHIARRKRKGYDLPQVYPGKVYAVERELLGVLSDEYESHFWWSYNQPIHHPNTGGDSCRSPLSFLPGKPLVSDRKSLSAGN